MTPSCSSRSTKLVRFACNLNLPGGPLEFVAAASEAVRREYRSSVRWKRLRCRNVQPLTEEPGETIFILEVGHSIQFDWTWEGAIASRRADPAGFQGDIDATDDFVGLPSYGAGANGRNGVWAGEVVEVDETNGRLFVAVSNLSQPPCRGTFFVRPFEFLGFLHSLFCQPGPGNLRQAVAARLNASRGDIHPPVIGGPQSGLEQFKQMWRHSWGVLWGPPGCGKTTNLGRQVASCLEVNERILVVSTTNKATDESAFAVGRAAAPGLVKGR